MSRELAEQVGASAEAAVASVAGHQRGALNYSVESLALVDEVLDGYAATLADAPEPVVRSLVERFGCYVLEVGRREFGGRYQWWEQRQAPVLVVGEPTLHIGLSTFDKVAGRLRGDQADSIPFLYEGFAQRVRTATAGTSATYV